MYRIQYHKQALKDIERCRQAGLGDKVRELVAVLEQNPYQNPPAYEKLIGDMAGLYSRRLNRQHRMVYTVDEERQLVRILALWTHYER